MKRLLNITLLCAAMILVFAGASFAKTSKAQSSKMSQSAMQQKIMREGITVKDKAGNSHYLSPTIIAANCSSAPNGKRGWWACLKNTVAFYADLALYYIFCDDNSGWCGDLADTIVDRYLYDLNSCSWFTLNFKVTQDGKSLYAEVVRSSPNPQLQTNSLGRKKDAKLLLPDKS